MVPEASASPAASPSSEPIASSGGGSSAQPTPGSIDPCSLLTADEASTAIGKKLSAGVSAQLDPDRVCTFKNGTTEVKVILAPPAPDAKTAQDDWDQARSEIPAGVPVTDLSYFDRSAYGSGSAGGLVERAVRDRRDDLLRLLLRFPGVQRDRQRRRRAAHRGPIAVRQRSNESAWGGLARAVSSASAASG